MFELIKIKYVYKGKDGKDHTAYNFYLVSESGNRIAVNPKSYIYDGETKSNFDVLYALARTVEDKK